MGTQALRSSIRAGEDTARRGAARYSAAAWTTCTSCASRCTSAAVFQNGSGPGTGPRRCWPTSSPPPPTPASFRPHLGILLFAEQPERYLPGAYIDVAAYRHRVADGNTHGHSPNHGTAAGTDRTGPDLLRVLCLDPDRVPKGARRPARLPELRAYGVAGSRGQRRRASRLRDERVADHHPPFPGSRRVPESRRALQHADHRETSTPAVSPPAATSSWPASCATT